MVDTRSPQSLPPQRPLIVMAVVMAHDLAAAALAMYLGVIARYAMSATLAPPPGLIRTAVVVFIAAAAIAFPLQRLHRGVWRFTALNDVVRIFYAVAIANGVFLVTLFLFNRLDGFPRSTLLIEGPLLVGFLSFSRFIRQLLASGDWRSLVRLEDRSKPAAILAGGHVALDAFLRDVARRPGGPPFRIRGLVEPSGAESGRLIHGMPVLGGPRAAMSALVSLAGMNGGRPQLVLVDPDLRRLEVRAFIDAAAEAGAGLVRARLKPGGADLSPLDAADLLSRLPHQLDAGRARQFTKDRRVVVTGAGGTIGAELTRQISLQDPASMELFDASELNLYEIERELSEHGRSGPARFILGDIRDKVRVETVLREARPDVVLHAAALKHVPLMEQNPAEAILTNVLGTINVAEAARDAGASCFVLISTDKAVNPTNVMGASKRAAELFVQALDAEGGPMRAVSVRFGNVLGSTGSVVPLFEHQIASGGPITVTHSDMTRYFMTAQEAASLVIQAGALAGTPTNGNQPRGAGIYVLDMGDPVSIEHLAHELCRLRGLEPGRDIEITYVGPRPGEKVHEDLFYDAEKVRETPADGVLAAHAPMLPMAELRPRLDALIEAARRRDRDAVYDALRELAPEFRQSAT